jgi:hypothetical protein
MPGRRGFEKRLTSTSAYYFIVNWSTKFREILVDGDKVAHQANYHPALVLPKDQRIVFGVERPST